MAMDEEKEKEDIINLSEAKRAMVRKVDGWMAVTVRDFLEGMGELGDDTFDMWLEADIRMTLYSFVIITYSLEADLDCGLRRTRRMTRTRMCTGSLSIGSRALWVARLYSRLRSNTFPV